MARFPRALVSAYRREGDTLLVELKLHDTRQLFNSLDPSPFIEKDLDDEAHRYIVDAVGEVRAHTDKKLVVYLPAALVDTEDARSVPRAVQSYFAYRAEHAAVQLQHVLREGFIALLIGLAFLGSCLTLREFAAPLLWPSVRPIIAEGLLIMGWVAMWRPIETFLYDWWPIRRHRALLTQIARMPIEVRPRRDP
jgi:hypothetical protein